MHIKAVKYEYPIVLQNAKYAIKKHAEVNYYYICG